MASRLLNDIAPECRPIFLEFIARCVEAGIPLMIVDTLRSADEQKSNLAKGVSWTKNSKHLPQPPSGKSWAIDVCPYEEFKLKGPDKLAWNADDIVWNRIGDIGERLGLRWGGRWKQRDMGHFEYVKPQTATVTT